MKAKFKVGDILQANDIFKCEGKRLFGDDFKYNDFKSKVIKVYENTQDIKDGQGDLIPNIYIFENDESICEAHLELVFKPKYRVMIEVDSDYTDLQSMAIWNEDTGIIEQWVGSFKEAQQYIEENGVWACDNSSNEEECED